VVAVAVTTAAMATLVEAAATVVEAGKAMKMEVTKVRKVM